MNTSLLDKLINVIRRGDVSEVESVLNAGAEINDVGSNGFTPLTQAAYTGRLAIARLLLDRGANVNFPDRQGFTPLQIAVDASIDEVIQNGGKQGDEETQMIELLLEYGASPTVPGHHNETPLELAVNYRSQKVVSLLKSWQKRKSHEGSAQEPSA